MYYIFRVYIMFVQSFNIYWCPMKTLHGYAANSAIYLCVDLQKRYTNVLDIWPATAHHILVQVYNSRATPHSIYGFQHTPPSWNIEIVFRETKNTETRTIDYIQIKPHCLDLSASHSYAAGFWKTATSSNWLDSWSCKTYWYCTSLWVFSSSDP